jgi:hypothetical protein
MPAIAGSLSSKQIVRTPPSVPVRDQPIVHWRQCVKIKLAGAGPVDFGGMAFMVLSPRCCNYSSESARLLPVFGNPAPHILGRIPA